MKKIHQTLLSPRSIERSPSLYRGVIMKLSDAALSGLVARGANTRSDEEGSFTNWGESSGTYASSDIRTARLYADTGALINRQTNELATRDQDDWTVGVVRRIDNEHNDLGFDRARPQKWLTKLDKWVSHYVMGRTEYITEQEIPEDKTLVREVYLFQGGKLYATFDTDAVALESIASSLLAHHNYVNGAEGGAQIARSKAPRMDRVMSSIGVNEKKK
jgi:hypothetical protein